MVSENEMQQETATENVKDSVFRVVIPGRAGRGLYLQGLQSLKKLTKYLFKHSETRLLSYECR